MKDYQIGGNFEKGKASDSNVHGERQDYLQSQKKRDGKNIVLEQNMGGGVQVDFTSGAGDIEVAGDLKGTRIIDGEGKVLFLW